MKAVVYEFLQAAKRSPMIYFAPLLGAIQGVQGEWKRHGAHAGNDRGAKK